MYGHTALEQTHPLAQAHQSQRQRLARRARRKPKSIVPHIKRDGGRAALNVHLCVRRHGVLGNIGVQKGAGVLQDLSHRLAAVKGAKLIVLGRVDPTYPLGATAHIHGGYLRPEIPALVARYGITDWLIPSIWPETFSYTTHEAIATGLPVWGFDLGAQADAIRNTKRGGVIAIPDGVPDLGALFDALLQPTLSFESAAA